MFAKKEKKYGDVLKYYTVINWDDREKYTMVFKKIIKTFNVFLENNSIELIHKFELNYSSKKSSLDSLYTKNEIVYANGENKNNSVKIIYGNDALNQMKKEKEKELIDIIIHFNEEITEKIILQITELINSIIPITYGYGFELRKNQEIISEGILKKTLFGVSSKLNDYKINTSIETGEIPKIYKYNFLNKAQIETNNISKYEVLSDNLFYKIG